MLSVDDYRTSIIELLGNAPIATLPLDECAGLVLAEEVRARVPLPPFTNSAMDGYAVRHSDITKATKENPIQLPVTEDIPAGRTDIPYLAPGTAHRIMTGAPLPTGADSVVMVEKTDGGTENVLIYEPVAAGAYLRHPGEDVALGTIALTENSVLGPAHLGLAAAIGLDRLRVRKPLRILVVSTGTELISPPSPLEPGQIYESNSIMLVAALKRLGCSVEVIRGIHDEASEFHSMVEPKLAKFDLVITSGGVSAGAYEVVKDGLAEQDVAFVKVAMQPGGPQGYGKWQGTPVITLPGNPVSVLVSFEAFLRPALLTCLGYKEVHRQMVRARLTEALVSPREKRQFRRGCYQPGNGRASGQVSPQGGPGSHLLAAFTQANCLIVIDETTTELRENEEVDVLLLT